MDKTLHPLTVFAVTDVERMVGFYEAAFGWTRRADFPIYVELALPDERGVAFYERNAFATNVGQLPRPVGEGELSGAELYLRCGDLDAAIEMAVNGADTATPESTILPSTDNQSAGPSGPTPSAV